MSYPKEVAAFIAWSKAMVQGASVERPKWKEAGEGRKKGRKPRRKRFRWKRSRRKKSD